MTDPDARYLTLIRHAKSSWDSDAPSDFERPLNRRGRRDAPRMGAELERLGIRFEHVFCSSAVRARETLAGLEQLELEKPSLRSSLPASLDTDIPPEMTELQAREIPREFLLSSEEEHKRASAFSYLLLLLLTLLLLGQLAWFNGDALLANPEVRSMAERLCPYVGCTLPKPPVESRFKLLDRRFEPTGPQTYRLSLLIQNGSARSEPPPAIQITFTDNQQRLVARRTLEAPVYLQQVAPELPPLKPGETLELELNLAVPAGPVTGYEIDFIPADA